MPLPGQRVDNYNFLSAPSFFDYDAMIVNMAAMTHLIESVVAGTLEPETFGRQRVCRVAQAADEVALADLLARRRVETKRLLANGGVVIVNAQPPAALRDIEGMDGLSSYWWLPAADGLRYDEHIVAAEGTQAQIVDYQHPLAPFVLGQLANVAYRARVDVDAMPSFGARGCVFVRSYGGAAIGVEVPAEAGRIVLLPAMKAAPTGDARYTSSEQMQSGVRRMLGVLALAEGREPPWAAKYTLPGLDALTDELQAARTTAEQAQRKLDETQAAHDELARYRALLWQEGALGLEPLVVDALKLLGFTVYDANPDEIEIRSGDTSALVEIDASDGEVGLAAHYRLRQRIERAIERRDAAPRGVIVINGHRHKPPAERPRQSSDALQLAAETMRYCIVTTAALFDAVRAHMSGEHANGDAFRDAILRTDGLVEAPAPN